MALCNLHRTKSFQRKENKRPRAIPRFSIEDQKRSETFLLPPPNRSYHLHWTNLRVLLQTCKWDFQFIQWNKEEATLVNLNRRTMSSTSKRFFCRDSNSSCNSCSSSLISNLNLLHLHRAHLREAIILLTQRTMGLSSQIHWSTSHLLTFRRNKTTQLAESQTL